MYEAGTEWLVVAFFTAHKFPLDWLASASFTRRTFEFDWRAIFLKCKLEMRRDKALLFSEARN